MRDRWKDWFHGDEQLLWEGAPLPGTRHWVRNSGLVTSFGLPFLGGGIACFGFGVAMLSYGFSFASLGIAVLLACFSVPFIAVGGWYTDYFEHKFVRYALSDRRACIASRWWDQKLEILEIRPDQRIEIKAGRDIYFHTITGIGSDGVATKERIGFENIGAAGKVYYMIRSIQAGEAANPS